METSTNSDERLRAKAREIYEDEGSVEVDDNAVVSRAKPSEGGAYIQAWVWVPFDACARCGEPHACYACGVIHVVEEDNLNCNPDDSEDFKKGYTYCPLIALVRKVVYD